MKKIILPLVAINIFFASSAFSGTSPAPYDFKKCASAATGDSHRCKSHAKRAREAKAKCEAMTDTAKKEECLKVLEAKAAKKG